MAKPDKISILGVFFSYVTFDETVDKLMDFLNGGEPRAIYTPNPEIIMIARKDAEFMRILSRADMVLPDGIGIVIASKFGAYKFRERVTGCDTSLRIFEKIKDTDKTVYFYGGAPGVAEEARIKLQASYPGLKIIGARDGFQDEEAQNKMIEEIKRLKPDILLVGTGSPRQERWIDKHKNELPCKILMGVGGSFDVYSGKVRRAPDIWVNMRLEWLYRLIKQPSRIKRQIQLPLFMLTVIKERFIKR